jgi:hypothetical protein
MAFGILRMRRLDRVGMAVLMMTTVALDIFSCRFIGRTKWDTLGLGIRYGREGTFPMMTVWIGLSRFGCLVLNAMGWRGGVFACGSEVASL